MDFTIIVLRDLLTELIDAGYHFMTVREFSGREHSLPDKLVVLRHDVDRRPGNSLAVAGIEAGLGVRGTYYFRIVPESLDQVVAGEIASMGHEVGYHYEDLSLASVSHRAGSAKRGIRDKGPDREADLAAMAFENFSKNLALLRGIAPVDTACMHGSPMSPHDSRMIWKYFDYGSLGVNAEPYFDLPLDEMLYLTDTGRRWDGSAVSLRDRIYSRNESYYSGWVRKPVPGSAMMMTEKGRVFQEQFRFRNTGDIIRESGAGNMPCMIFLTIHPQRWSDKISQWAVELIAQNVKNQVKYLINRRKSGE